MLEFPGLIWNSGSIRFVIAWYVFCSLPTALFLVLYLLSFCLFVPLVLTAHCRVHWIDDIFGASVLRWYGFPSSLTDLQYIFVSAHSPFACIVVSSFGLFTVSCSSLFACMRCRKAMDADATIMCFGIGMAFADRFVKLMYNSPSGRIPMTPLAGIEHLRSTMLGWVSTSRKLCPKYLSFTADCVNKVITSWRDTRPSWSSFCL